MSLANKAQSSITVAFIGPYNWYPGLIYNGSQVIRGYDQLDLTALSDSSRWNADSFFYWNQVALEIAVDVINHDPNLLPNTTIKIKRFKNNYYSVQRKQQNPGYAIAVANEIANEHPDVVAVFGGNFVEDMTADGEVYGYYKILQCTASELRMPLANRNNYPYYFQTTSATGYAEAIGLLLRSWNVNRIAVLAPNFLGDKSVGGYVANSLHSQGFDVLARFRYREIDEYALDNIIAALERVEARYITGLAKRKRLVGKDYVWIVDKAPLSFFDPVPVWGPEYYKEVRGIILLTGINALDSSLLQEEYKLMRQLYDCTKIFATGLHNLLTSNPFFTTEMASTRRLQDLMNYTLFRDTGYNGIVGAPVKLTKNGDVQSVFNIFYMNGKSSALTAPQFAITDIDVTKIMQWKTAKPIFYDGSSIPPPDGPAYTHVFISPTSSTGLMLQAFTGFGITAAIAFLIIVLLFRKKKAIRSGSVIFLTIMTIGTIPSHVSHLMYIGMPTVFQCQARLWLQLASFALCLGSTLSKNARVTIIYSSKKIIPNYIIGDLLWVIATLSVFIIEMILVSSWSILSKTKVKQTLLAGYTIEYSCAYGSSNGYKVGAALWTLNILLLLVLYLIAHKSQNISPVHSEFTLLFFLSVSLSVSAVLAALLSTETNVIQSQFNQSILVFINTCLPLVMQAVPRVAVLLQESHLTTLSGVLSTVRRGTATYENGGMKKFSVGGKLGRNTSVASQSPSVTMFKRGSSVGNDTSEAGQTSNSMANDRKMSVFSTGARKSSRAIVDPSTAKKRSKFTRLVLVSYCFQASKRVSVLPKKWKVGAMAGGVVSGKAFLVFLPHAHDLDSDCDTFPIMWLEKRESKPEFTRHNKQAENQCCVQGTRGFVFLEFLTENSGDGFVTEFNTLVESFFVSVEQKAEPLQ
ncbi:periplasmic binding protein-like I [Obelidium mucronatum]|nr:periplasmic binding protein-like I [Obelidium mucronatum]